MTIRAAVVTVSDKGSVGEREDVSGPVLAQGLVKLGVEVTARHIVPDDTHEIAHLLARIADSGAVDCVLTTGGTGLTPRDNTPEATLQVVDHIVPGIAEALRFEGYRRTPLAVLSRGVAGLRRRCLIINLPGSPKAVREGLETLGPILAHAIRMARGLDTEHDRDHKDAHGDD